MKYTLGQIPKDKANIRVRIKSLVTGNSYNVNPSIAIYFSLINSSFQYMEKPKETAPLIW